MLVKLFFAYHAFVIVLLSLLIVSRRNPVHSVLFMLVLFFHIASLYLFLNAEFMAAIQLIVYAGAILVLFLFVILLLNLKQETIGEQYTSVQPSAVVIAAALFVVMALSVASMELGRKFTCSIDYIKETGHIKAIGEALYTQYIFPFEVASVLLLIAIVGAITLAKKKHITLKEGGK